MSRVRTNVSVLDQTIVSGVNFATGLILARFLSMESYGIFVLAYGVILFVSSVQMALVIAPMMVRGPALEAGAARPYYASALAIQLAFAAGALLALAIGIGLADAWAFEGRLRGLLLPLSAATGAFVLQDFLRRHFFCVDRADRALVNDCISYGSQILILLVVQATVGLSIELALLVIAGTSALAVVHGGVHWWIARAGRPARGDVRAALRFHWDHGKWLVAQNASYWMGAQLVVYLCGIFLSVAAVGAMSAARNVVGVTTILLLALDNFAAPRASRVHASRGVPGLREYLLRVTLLGGAATALVALVATLAPELWLTVLYGERYQGYGWLVGLWAAYFLIGFPQRPTAIGLRVLQQTRWLFAASLAGMVVVLLLGYPGIRYGGIVGALLVMILGQAVISVAQSVRCLRALGAGP